MLFFVFNFIHLLGKVFNCTKLGLNVFTKVYDIDTWATKWEARFGVVFLLFSLSTTTFPARAFSRLIATADPVLTDLLTAAWLDFSVLSGWGVFAAGVPDLATVFFDTPEFD